MTKRTTGKKADVVIEDDYSKLPALDVPEVSDADMAFGGYPAEWFQSALSRPFSSEKNKREYKRKANDLFFNGGLLRTPTPATDEYRLEYEKRCSRMARAVLGSYLPKHEEKEYVVGILLETMGAEVVR